MKSTVKPLIAAYVAVLLTFALLDGIWLGAIAMPWYQDAFKPLLKQTFLTWPWITFYLLYGAAVVYLVIRPYVGQNLMQTTMGGLVLGATAYGTYNLTCYAIIANWPLDMTIIDWIWGTVATGSIATSGGWVARKFI